MLLSLEKNFIFIHVPKTAGSSMERVLRPWCVKSRKSQWRRLLSHLPVRETPEKAMLRQHGTAAWLKWKLPPALYDGAHKFAVVRNPFDLAVSNFHHLRMSKTRRYHEEAKNWDLKTFLGYLERKNRMARVDQTSWISDRKGNIIIDEILHFETLAAEFDLLSSRLGLPPDLKLQHVNTTTHDDYRGYYDEETKAMVLRLYARDFERFGHEF